MASPERRGRKLADPAGLRRMRATDAIQHPLVPEMQVLDTTDMTAEDAAAVVVRHVTGLREAGRLLPAGDQHRKLAVGDSAASSPA